MSTSLSCSSKASTDLNKFRRTNSLAFAKSDCHTCSSLNVRCDRQRPRCTPCQDAGILCQGYSMKLTWHQSHSVVNKPPKVKTTTATGLMNCSTGVQNHERQGKDTVKHEINADKQNRKFMFVAARPPKRRKKSHHPQSATNSEYAAFSPRRQSVTARTSSSSSTGVDLDVAESGNLPNLLARLSQSHGQAPTATATGANQEDILQIPLPSPPAIPDLEGGLDPSGVLSWQHQQDLDWISPPYQQTTGDLDLESLEQCLEIQQQPIPLAGPPSPNFGLDLNLDLSQSLWQEEEEEEEEDCDPQLTLAPLMTRLSPTSDHGGLEMPMTIPQMCYSTLTEKFYGLLDMCKSPFPSTHVFLHPYSPHGS